MKYEKPQVVELNHAIAAIQGPGKPDTANDANQDTAAAYEDWEE